MDTIFGIFICEVLLRQAMRHRSKQVEGAMWRCTAGGVELPI